MRTPRWAIFLFPVGVLLAAASCTSSPPPSVPSPPLVVARASDRFVGDAACTGCHEEAFRAHKTSRHKQTLWLMDKKALGELAPPTGEIGTTPYELMPVQDRYLWGTAGEGTELHLAFGSGKSGMTYAAVAKGRLTEVRLSYYPLRRAWYLTPGQEQAGGLAAGSRHDAEFSRRCVLCHAVTLPEDSLIPEPKFMGVGCESCHGAGGDHAEAQKAGKPEAVPMAKLGGATGTQINELCGKCHTTQEMVESKGLSKDSTNRFQPYGLALSKCFQQSKETLTCLSCHAAHQDAEKSPKFYEKVCLSCHNAPSSVFAQASRAPIRGKACPVNPNDGCIPCHMPSRKALPTSAFDVKMADHFIHIPKRTSEAQPP